MLGRAYPGNSSHRAAWQKLLASLAKQVPQSVTVAPVPGKEPDIQAVSFAAYPSRAYFLNTDCVKERTVIATIDGRKQELTLAAHEFRIMERKK